MFDEGKLQTLLLMVFGVVILIVAIAVAATAKRAKYSETVRVGFNVVVSIVLVAVGLGAIGYAAFGTQVLEGLGIIQGSGSGHRELMPLLRTDDGPRRLRAIWLGPNGATLPFEWTYVQWGVVLLTACLVGNVFGLLAWWWTGDIVYTIAAIVLWGWPAGVYLGTRVMRGVSFDEPSAIQARVAS